MNSEGQALQQRKTRVIAAVIGLHLVFGALLVTLFPQLAGGPDAAQEGLAALRASPVNLVYQVATLVACFAWLGLDSRQLDIRRPWWLNLGVIFMMAVFVPYYLYKTRPAGRRGSAILAFLGVAFASFMAIMAGMFIAIAFQGGPSAPAAPGL